MIVLITIQSKKRSFLKVKVLQSYLRFSMTQERLNFLVLILIENEFLENIDDESITNEFASKNPNISMFRK